MPSTLALPFALVNLLLIAGALVASRRELSGLLPRSRDERRALLAVFILALVLRAANPYRDVLWLDEWYILGQADGLVHHHINAFCIQGRMGDCQRFSSNEGIGYPLLLSLASSLLGYSNLAVRVVGVLSGTITVVLVYLIVRLLARDHRSALLAALVLALLPMHVRYGVTLRLTVTSVLTECLAVLGAALHVRTGRTSAGWLAAASLAFHMTVRKENPVAIVPMLVLYWWGRDRDVRPSPIPWIVGLVLLTPHIAEYFDLTMGYSDFFKPLIVHNALVVDPPGERLGISVLVRNVDYVLYWLNGYFHPFLFTALAALGLAALVRRPCSLLPLVVLWWSARLVVFLVHDIPYYIPRYMLGLSVPFAVACGLGARSLKRPQRHIVAALVLSGLAHLPFAYSDMYGLQLDAGVRTALYAVHLALPVAILVWAAGKAGGRERHLLAGAAIAGAVLVATFYPRVNIGDGVPPDVRDYLTFEERTVSQWRDGVGPECYVVASVPVRAERLWGRRVVHVESFVLTPDTRDHLLRDVTALTESGKCVYLYNSAGWVSPFDALADGPLILEQVESVALPPEWNKAFGATTNLSLYRVGQAGG